MFWKTEKPKPNLEDSCAEALYQILANGLKSNDGRIRAEDLITAAASITGERCIEAAGDFDPREHHFAPGSRIFSDKINKLLTGDVAPERLKAIPADSVVGTMRDKLLSSGYAESDFPSLQVVFEDFAANIGNKADWGKVPLLVPEENKPMILPLRVNYETRSIVDKAFQPLAKPEERLRAALLTLCRVLIAVQNAISKKTALLLALQLVNGMSKTAPMTDQAMAAAKNRSSRQ